MPDGHAVVAGQITEQIAGMRAGAGAAFPASSAYALHFSGYGSGVPFHQPAPIAAADHAAATTLSNFSASAPINGSFAQGLPSPNSLPFTMGAEPQAPSWGSRARRARRVASASVNPPRFRNRMQQRREQGSQ